MLTRIKHFARNALLNLRARWPRPEPSPDAPCCNICGFAIKAARDVIAMRETPSCSVCGSTLRFRSIMAALQRELDKDDRIRPIETLPKRKWVKGLGMSDAGPYAYALSSRFDYINTYFHMRPRLDIRRPDQKYVGKFDFVVSSDVLEHVDGSPQTAFDNLHSLLKKGGVIALTVPYGLQDATIEHYPNLHQYKIEGEGDKRVLVNMTKDGKEERFTDLCFHGGDGSTLELRIYAYQDLVKQLTIAGFTDIKLHSEQHPEWGIIHANNLGLPVTARA